MIMGLEFKINDCEKANKQLKISVNKDDDLIRLHFEVKDNRNKKRIAFDALDMEEILELGLMVNCQSGVEIFNLDRIKIRIKKETGE